jgi:hypothetical protein
VLWWLLAGVAYSPRRFRGLLRVVLFLSVDFVFERRLRAFCDLTFVFVNEIKKRRPRLRPLVVLSWLRRANDSLIFGVMGHLRATCDLNLKASPSPSTVS